MKTSIESLDPGSYAQYAEMADAVTDGWYVSLSPNGDGTFSGGMKRGNVVIEEHNWQGRNYPTVEALVERLLARCNSRKVDR